ncbi:MAG TPA: efflux transporter outer membrane subunit [Caulobacteraceae bacterium]|jgi:NodT family efflux transporter outer membrane factor (OMF) lipoprotein
MPSWNRSALLAAAAAGALLTACAAVGPNYAVPAAPKVSGYAMAGDTASKVPALGEHAEAAGGWWSAFGSPDLDRTIQQALSDSPTLAAADATLEQARAAAEAQHNTPTGAFNASAERTRINLAAFGIPGFPSPTVNQYSVGGNIAYDLDLFGGVRRANESAVAQAEAQGQHAKAAYLTLTGNVAMAAVRIATLRAQIAAIASVIDEDAKNLDFIRKAQAAGAAAPAAQVSARAQMVQDQALLPDLRQQLAEARHGLALLVGHAPSDWTAPDFDLAALTLPGQIPVELPSELIRRRPDILAAEADLHAATADIGVQTAKLYPDVKLSAAIAQTSLVPEKLFQYDFSGWNFGPAVSVPIFGRAQMKAQVHAAEAAAKAANARYQQTVLTAFTQVADVMQALANDEAAVSAQDEARRVAEQDLKNSEFAYQNGGGTLVDVTQAQRRLSETRQAYALAQGKRYSDAVRLYIATAADWTAAAPQRTASK